MSKQKTIKINIETIIKIIANVLSAILVYYLVHIAVDKISFATSILLYFYIKNEQKR